MVFGQRQWGVGLIEVLVALLVTAIGLLGLAGLQGKAQQAEMESYQRSQALALLEDMANRLRANRTGRNCYVLADSGIDYVGAGNDGFSGLSCGDARASEDVLAWHNQLRGAGETLSGNTVGAMIGARGCITQIAADDFAVSVAWQGLTSIPVDNGAASQDLRLTDSCGMNLYGTEDLRRVISTRVTFFNPL
jgi:type IV pilus assembly protein PilV